jgi:tRNA uracil 4-sulfurtransferase
MLYDRILVKYGELSIKGKNKNRFIDRMINTIKFKCSKLEKLYFEKRHSRLYIHLNGEDYQEVIKCLNKVFGLHAYSLAVKTTLDIEKIKEKSLELIQEEITENVTFKVNTHRSNKNFPIQSMDVSRQVASYVLKGCSNLKVDVNKPEVTLNIDIRQEGVYLMLKEVKGLGGLPVGVDGKGMLMISGGIDSPVAGYLIQKRGLYIEAIHFASPPYTNIQAKQKVVDLLQKIAIYHPDGKLKLHVIPFTEIQRAIYQYCPANYGITIMRRMMYRISEEVAKLNDALVIVNGESLGQVASQTIESMRAINEVTNMPVLRPLVAMDKLEIIGISKKIDTYNTSILPFEDCCTIFIPENPVIKPDLEKVHEYEAAFDFTPLMKEAIERREEIILDENQPLDLVLDDKSEQLF